MEADSVKQIVPFIGGCRDGDYKVFHGRVPHTLQVPKMDNPFAGVGGAGLLHDVVFGSETYQTHRLRFYNPVRHEQTLCWAYLPSGKSPDGIRPDTISIYFVTALFKEGGFYAPEPVYS